VSRLLLELNVADALQPVFQCREPEFVEQIADEVCAYYNSSEVRRNPCCWHAVVHDNGPWNCSSSPRTNVQR